jgi:type IX secretion system substrate protein
MASINELAVMNRLLIISITILYSSLLNGQEIKWQKTIGGSDADDAVEVVKTSDGGFLIGGRSKSDISGDKSQNSRGNYDIWILKTDSVGNITWDKTIGGNGWDQLASLIQTFDDGYLVFGISSSDISGDKTEDSMGSMDFWVIKLDPFGTITWQNTIGGIGYDRPKDVMQLADSSFLLFGNSDSPISGDKTADSIGYEDYWIVLIDNNGSIIWDKSIGGNHSDVITSVEQTSDGGYLFGGSSRSGISGDKTQISRGFEDYWIFKTDSAFNILWQQTIGGNKGDDLYSLIQTSDNNYLLSGLSSSDISGEKNANSIGNYDYWVIKIDSLGNIYWQSTLGGSNAGSICRSGVMTSSNEYLIGGGSWADISINKTENSINASNDFWILNFDSLGNIIWQNTIGGNTGDGLWHILPLGSESYLLTGYSYSDISGDKTENSKGGTDIWMVCISNSYGLIKGSTYFDVNSNGQQDTLEPELVNKKIIEDNWGTFSFTTSKGEYSIAVPDTGMFHITPGYGSNYYSPIPTAYNILMSNLQQVDSLNDFAFQPSGVYNDLCVDIAPTGPFRSGFDANYSIDYSNLGTTIQNATIVFYLDTSVTFVNSITAPTTIYLDSLVYSIGSLTPFQTGQILITVNIQQGLPNGSLINSGVAIFPKVGDANPICNQSWWEVFTTGSYDPNDILVNRDTLYDFEILTPPDLEYIIRFQNTGNDTAFTVKVLNPIDTTKLELSTLEIVSTSHSADISWIPWERNMEFLFENILLPDSNVNEPMSYGYIRYRIKSRTNLMVGDTVNNQAYIYFDFNDPIPTNIATTQVVMFTGTYETDSGISNFNVYPNPAKSTLNIHVVTEQPRNISLELYNIYGQKIEVVHKGIVSSNDWIKEIDISHLNSGVYFIMARGGINNATRFIKQ